VQTVVIVPPVAAINCADAASSCKPESVTNQPFVESIKTKVTARPLSFKGALPAIPPILSEPFGTSVKFFAGKVPA